MSTLGTAAGDLRANFLAMAQEADLYPFISTVEMYLAQVPDDWPMRGLAMKALAGKGLLSIAVEIGRACPRSGPEAGQLLDAAEQLAKVPNEIVPWAKTHNRFAANLAALRSRGQNQAMLADALANVWPAMEKDLTLHQANDGNLLVRGSRSDGTRMWIPAALDFRNAVEHIAKTDAFKGKCGPPLLIDGVGMGWWLSGLYAMTARTFLDYSSTLYIVETNLKALALVLRLHDWSAELADPRVYILGGPDAWETWRNMMIADTTLPLPSTCQATVRWPGQKPTPGQERLAEVNRHRIDHLIELRRRAEEIYADRDAAWWARRYAAAGPQDPLRVLCVTSRFTTFLKYSMRDTVSALEGAGIRTRLLIEAQDHLILGPHAYMETFIEFQPDLVLMIDHHRHEQPNAFINNVPFACWIQDPLPNLMCRRAGEALGPLDFTFGYYRNRCTREFGYPADRFFTAPIPVADAMFSEEPVSDEEAKRLACDVMYVGHLNQTIEALRTHWRAEQPRELHPILDDIDAFVDRVLERGEHLREHYSNTDPTELVRRLAGDRGKHLRPEDAERLFTFYANRTFDIGFRVRTLQWVARWARDTGRVFRLYGNGWQHVRELAPFAVGPIEHGEPLRRAYRCATFAIQTMPAGFRHQRSLEAIAGGCLVLTRYIATDFGGLDLEEARRRRKAGEPLPATAASFPRLDMVTFRDPQEMASVAQELLDKPDLRRELLAEFRERVLQEFSYGRVIRTVIEYIRDALQQQASVRQGST
ncbi:MAG TPA: glycosyltransferase [Phycisphaerae bacterium]|nr:glycosyltransferase [Phycisphaerae bacterium]HRR84967.1 glycosyltransferase [Phycisphaerae bacterium]